MAPSKITEDYYAILEVSNTATSAEITKSYKSLAFRWHPDRNKDAVEQATARFQLASSHPTTEEGVD